MPMLIPNNLYSQTSNTVFSVQCSHISIIISMETANFFVYIHMEHGISFHFSFNDVYCLCIHNFIHHSEIFYFQFLASVLRNQSDQQMERIAMTCLDIAYKSPYDDEDICCGHCFVFQIPHMIAILL